MSRLTPEKNTLTSKISASDRPMWSCQNTVMIAMGKSIIFSALNRFSLSTLAASMGNRGEYQGRRGGVMVRSRWGSHWFAVWSKVRTSTRSGWR